MLHQRSPTFLFWCLQVRLEPCRTCTRLRAAGSRQLGWQQVQHAKAQPEPLSPSAWVLLSSPAITCGCGHVTPGLRQCTQPPPGLFLLSRLLRAAGSPARAWHVLRCCGGIAIATWDRSMPAAPRSSPALPATAQPSRSRTPPLRERCNVRGAGWRQNVWHLVLPSWYKSCHAGGFVGRC